MQEHDTRPLFTPEEVGTVEVPEQPTDIGEERRIRLSEAIRTGDEGPLWELLQQYMQVGRGGQQASKQTLQTYRSGLQKLMEFLRVHHLTLLELRDEKLYFQWLKDSGYKGVTIGSRLSTARKLFAALRWAQLLEHELKPVRVSDRRAAQPTRRPYLTAEVERLIRHADVEEKLIVLLGVKVGLRPGEMVNLRREQVLTDPSPSLLLPNADGHERRFPISEELARLLNIWLQTTSPKSGKVFGGRSIQYVEQRLRDLCQRAGVPFEDRGVHGLRLTAGAMLFQQTQSLATVRTFLRVTGKTSSKTYAEAAALLKEHPAHQP